MCIPVTQNRWDDSLALIKAHHWNAAVYLGTSLLAKAASTVLLIPLYTSRLTRAEYGAFGLCATLYSIAPPVLSLAMTAAFARFYFDDINVQRRNALLGHIGRRIVAISVGCALVLELLLDLLPHAHLGDLAPRHLRLALWTAACTPLSDLGALFWRQEQRALRFATLNLTQFVASTATTAYLLVVAHWGLMAPLTGVLAGQATGAAYGVFLLATRLKVRGYACAPGLLARAARYSTPLVPHVIGNALLVGADRWALEYYGLKEELGLYTLAAQLTLPIILVQSAWNEAAAPPFMVAWRDHGVAEARRQLPRIIAGFLLACGSAFVALVLALPLLRHFVNVRFQAAFPLVPFIGLGLVVGSVFSAFVFTLEYRKQTALIPILTLGSVGLNIALNFVLVPRFGVYGAIAGTGIAYSARAIVFALAAARSLRSDPLVAWQPPARNVVPSA